jgi:uncharacterized membrane protein
MITFGLVLQFWYWPQLPERMAIHFDAKGNPNDWLDKLPATLLSAGLIVFVPVFFIGISQIAYWLPASLINIPHREYWLASERRNATLNWMTGWMLWFAVLISIFVLAINHLTFTANRDALPLSPFWFWSSLGIFLSTTFVMVAIMIRRFHLPTRRAKS